MNIFSSFLQIIKNVELRLMNSDSLMKHIFFGILFFTGFISCHTEEKKYAVGSAIIKDEMVKPEGKDSMILLTDRPPNLETPLKYFLLDFTPNNVFFVRWHLSGIPKTINTDTFRLHVSGNVKQELALSMNDLKTKFKPFSIVAIA